MPIDFICKHCGKTFTDSPSAKRQFCSKKCTYLGKRMRQPNGPIITCPICGKERRIKPSHNGRVFTCGKRACTIAYKRLSWKQELEKDIGEPFESAVQRLYVLERKSYREIAAQLGVNFRTVMRTLKKIGIKPRQGSAAVATQWEGNDKRRKEQGERFRELRADFKGVNHPCWRGGSFSSDYEMRGWREYAESIRARDGHKCTRCQLTNEQHQAKFDGYSLCVHHIVPYKLSKDNSPENLRALCVSCHAIVENEFLWLL